MSHTAGSRLTAYISSYVTNQLSSVLTNVNISAPGSSANVSAVAFSNANGVSFGLNGGTITASHNGITSQSNPAFSAQGGSSTFQTVVFTNANGISFSNNNGSIQASHNGITSQTNQALTMYALGNTNGSSSTVLNASALSISAVGSLTVGYTNGTLRFSAPNAITSQTNQSVGIYALGNSTQSSSGTRDARSLSFNGLGIISVGISGGSIQLSATTAAQTNQTVGVFALGNTTQNSSTTVDARSLSINGAGNITVGASNGSIVISGSQSVQPQTVQPVAASGSNGSFVFSTLSFGNSNGLSFYTSNGSIVGSYTVTPADGVNILAAGTQTANTTGTVRFADSNGMTFGMSNNSVITASHNGITSQSIQTQNAVSVQGSTGNISFSNSNGITFGYNASTITASHNGITSQTNQNISLYGLGNTTQNSSTVLNASNISFNGLGIVTVGYSNGSIQISASTSQSVQPQTVQTQNMVSVQGSTGNISFSNSNGITFGYNASTITASHNGITSQSNQNISLYGLGNTTQNSSTVLNANNLSFNGLGIVTVGYSNGSIQLSASTSQSVQTQNAVSVQGSTGDINFSNANGITFGYNASTITASHNGLTSQSNQAVSGSNGSFAFQTLSFGNSNGLSFYTSNGSIVGSYSTNTPADGVNILAAGTQTANTTGTVRFADSNGISFGMSNNSVITASYTVPAQTNQNISLYGVGNTTQNSSTVLNASNLSFNGLGIVTVGYSNGSIQLSASTSQSVQTQNAVSVQGSTGNISFSNSNGITFGYNASTITASHNGITSQSVQTQNAVSVQGSTGNISFSNSNGITFGYNASTITASHNGLTSQTNQNISLYGLGNTTQNSSAVLNASNISFNGLGIVTVGYSNGSIQISASTSQSVQPQTVQTQNMVSVQNSTGNISFSNANGITFGFNASTITASHNGLTSQSNQNISLYGLGNTTQNSSTVLNANNLSFNGLGIVTVGYSNGSIQLSASTSQSVQTQNTVSIQGSTGNISFSNSNGITFGFNASTITASHNGLTSQSNQAVSGSNGSFAFQTLSFGNSNGLSFYTSNGSIVGSYSTNTPADGVNILAAGTQTANTTGTVRFADSNGISFGMSNSSVITASYTVPTQSNQNISLYGLGNTTQNSSTVLNASNLSFNGLGIVTVGYSNGSIQISASTSQSIQPQTVQTQNMVSIQNSTGNISLSNANGITFGFNASTITASHNGITSQSNQNISLYGLGNTTQNSSTVLNANNLSFNGLGIVTVGYSNGSIQISATNAQSVQTQNLVSIQGSTGNISFSSANGITFGFNASTITASHNGITSQSNQAVSAANGSYAFQTLSFSNANGISFGTSAGSAITASYTFPTQTVQPVAASGSNGSFAFSTITFGNLNGMSFYTSNGSMVGSYTTGGDGVNILAAGTQTANTTGTVRFADSNGLTFGMSNSSVITMSHNGLTSQSNQAVSAANGSYTFQTLSFSNANGISFGTSAGSAITASYTVPTQTVQPVAVSGSNGSFAYSTLTFGNLNGMSFYTSNGSMVGSYTTAPDAGYNILAAGTQTANTTGTVRFADSNGITFGMSNNSVITASVNAGGGFTKSGHNPYADLMIGLGTIANGVLMVEPETFPSVSFDRGIYPMSYSHASNSTGTVSISAYIGIYSQQGAQLAVHTSASTVFVLTNNGTVGNYSLYSGMRHMTIPFPALVSENQYWIGAMSRTTFANANATISNIVVSQNILSYVGVLGAPTNNTNQFTLGQGVFSVTTAALPNIINFAQINGTGSAVFRSPAVMFALGTF